MASFPTWRRPQETSADTPAAVDDAVRSGAPNRIVHRAASRSLYDAKMTDYRADDLSIDIGSLRPTPGAVHVAAGLPDGMEQRVLQWFSDHQVVAAVDFWREENTARRGAVGADQVVDGDVPDDVDLYVVLATDDQGAVQIRADDGSLVAGPPLQEVRWRLRNDLGADDVVFDDWDGAALWSAHDSAAALDTAAEGAELPVPEDTVAALSAEVVEEAADPADDGDDRWAGPTEPEPQHVLAFSRRGTAHGHLLASQAKADVHAGHLEGWSVFRYTSQQFVELTPPRKGELPAITVRHGRDDYGDAWVEVDTHGDLDGTGFGLWPSARSAMRPVFAPEDLDADAAALQARVLDESLDPDSDLHLLAADEVIGSSVDLTVLNRGLAPHPIDNPRSSMDRIEDVLVGLGLPSGLVHAAVHGDALPEQIAFAPAGMVDAVLQTVAAGRAGLRPVGEPLSAWDTVEQRVRRDPKWAAGLVSTELVLGIGALWAGRKVGRRSRTAGGLLTVLGVTALADAVFEAFLVQVRQTSGQPYDYRAAAE